MWVRFLKSHHIAGRKYCIGKVLKLTNAYATEIIKNGIAELYTGTLPPQKVKTEFFKPKK